LASHPPAAEKEEDAHNESSDHGPRCGEGPVVVGVLLGHGFELVNQYLSIELPGNLGAKLFNSCGDNFVFRFLEKLSQGPCPV